MQLFVAVLLLGQTKPDLLGGGRWIKPSPPQRRHSLNILSLDGPPAPVAPAGHEFDTMRPQTVTHRDPSLVIIDEPSGNLPERTYKLTTDGKPNITELPGGGVNRSLTRWDGKQLVTEWVLEQGGAPIMRGTDHRSLSSDGSILIQDRTVLTPLHETQLHIVWIRKNK